MFLNPYRIIRFQIILKRCQTIFLFYWRTLRSISFNTSPPSSQSSFCLCRSVQDKVITGTYIFLEMYVSAFDKEFALSVWVYESCQQNVCHQQTLRSACESEQIYYISFQYMEHQYQMYEKHFFLSITLHKNYYWPLTIYWESTSLSIWNRNFVNSIIKWVLVTSN